MCGIVGYFGPREIDLTLAAGSILHRGPDMQSITSGSGWKIAFNRLSILDTSQHGMQPFSFDGVTVWMNGEIYNYIELRERHRKEFEWRTGSDVEIVPFLYRKFGIAFLHMLNGMFAMVIVDERHAKRFLVRDRFGKKPLYYCHAGEQILFASEIKALKKITRLRPDRTNLALNLSCWFLIQPLSLYEGVLNVNPGCYLDVNGVHAVERRWYEPQIRVESRSEDEVQHTIMEIYRDAVRLRLRSDVPVGIYLSGGLDSVSMAHLARVMSPVNLCAFTARIQDKESWESNNTDTDIVTRYCAENDFRMKAVDLDFNYWDRNIIGIIGNYEELFTDMGVLIFYGLAEAARSMNVKVLFSGVGGDENFGGYPWQARLRQLPATLLERGLSRRHASSGYVAYNMLCRLRNRFTGNRAASFFRLVRQPRLWHAQSLGGAFNPYMRDVNSGLSARIGSISAEYFRIAARISGDDLVNRINYANVFTVLGNQNYQVDLASMRYSVENRSPLLDYRLVEYMLSVPDAVKIAGGPKSLMRGVTAHMLPPYVISAKKSGPSMPLDVWLAAPGLRRTLIRFLTRHKALIGDVVSSDLASHVGSPSFHDGRGGAVMTFALVSLVIWAKQNCDSLSADPAMSFTALAQEF